MDSGNAPQGPPLCLSGCGFFGCVPRARRGAAQRVGARVCSASKLRNWARVAGGPPALLAPRYLRAPLTARLVAARSNPATANMCSKCYKEHAKESSGPGPLATMVAPPPPPAPTVAAPPAVSAAAAAAPEAPAVAPAPEAAVPEATPNRCSTCTKRTGLTGFKCRCGATFCSTHRYADAHNCQFDYKAAAAAQLTKANPAVVASKLDKL